MSATDLQVTPQLPDGIEIVSGPATQSAGTFPAGAVRQFSWVVRAAGDGPRTRRGSR